MNHFNPKNLKHLTLLLLLLLTPGCDNTPNTPPSSTAKPATPAASTTPTPSSTLQYKEFDAKLAQFASGGSNIVEALTKYLAEHKSFPTDANALKPYVNDGFYVANQNNSQLVNGWIYSADSTSFTLGPSITGDPALFYKFKNGSGQWLCIPADGSPQKLIRLNP